MNLEEMKLLNKRSSTAWKYDIIEYLKSRPDGASVEEIYSVTRPDQPDADLPKIKNDLASQKTYMKDIGYFVHVDKTSWDLMTEPHTSKKGEFLTRRKYQEEIENIIGRKLRDDEFMKEVKL